MSGEKPAWLPKRLASAKRAGAHRHRGKSVRGVGRQPQETLRHDVRVVWTLWPRRCPRKPCAGTSPRPLFTTVNVVFAYAEHDVVQSKGATWKRSHRDHERLVLPAPLSLLFYQLINTQCQSRPLALARREQPKGSSAPENPDQKDSVSFLTVDCQEQPEASRVT